MSTIKRKWHIGVSCHVTARDNHRNDISRDGEDFLYYLTLIKKALEYYYNYKFYFMIFAIF